MKFLWPWLLAILSGILVASCYAPINLPSFAWVSLAPLVCGVWFFKPADKKYKPLILIGLGYVSGAVGFLMDLYWLASLTTPGWILLSLYLAVYPAIWTLFVGTICHPVETAREGKPAWLNSWQNLRIAIFASSAWVGLEWLRGIVFSGFGWNGLGVSMHANVPLIQLADITGVGGISFLIVMVNIIGIITVKRISMEVGLHRVLRPHYDFSITIAMVSLSWVYGMRQMFATPDPQETLTVAAVQANVPQFVRNDNAQSSDVLGRYVLLTETAIAMRPDLILWPESASPEPVFAHQPTWDTVRGLAEKHPGDFLLGTVNFDPTGAYNSVVLLTKNGNEAQIYNKMHLVPFGEFVPLRKGFPFFAWVVGDLVPDDFNAGINAQILEMSVKNIKIGPLICFEDTLGNLARRFALGGAQLFATVTNDGWFLKSAGSEQHLANAVFRCAESKLPMVRAANTGVTCVINRFGFVRQKLQDENGSTFLEGVLRVEMEIPKTPKLTFYSRNGEIFSHVCLVLALAGTAIFAFGKKSACAVQDEKKM